MGSDYGGILLSRIIKEVMLYLFTLLVIKLILLCSGNVELNPGPSGRKTCLSCHEKTILLKLRVYPCVYIFRKKSYRQPHASFGTVPNTSTSTLTLQTWLAVQIIHVIMTVKLTVRLYRKHNQYVMMTMR